ncbi:hypothetical protein D3C87_1545380 [compost metagenome]
MRGQGWRRHHPADTPAGHGVGFRQAVEGRGALGHARQARRADVFAFEQQFAVDLIGNQPQVVADAQLSQGGPGAARQTRAGRVVRAVQCQRPGARSDARGDIFGQHAKAVFRAYGHRHHHGTASTEYRFVGDVHGLGDDHFVTRIEYALGHAEQRTLRPGQYGDLIGRNALAAALLMTPGDGFTQGTLAAHLGIVRVAV